jgi:hypothetical protein
MRSRASAVPRQGNASDPKTLHQMIRPVGLLSDGLASAHSVNYALLRIYRDLLVLNPSSSTPF